MITSYPILLTVRSQPNSIDAKVGDVVQFQFVPNNLVTNNHSVIRSQYGYPCMPIELVNPGGPKPFFSGFFLIPAGSEEVSMNVRGHSWDQNLTWR